MTTPPVIGKTRRRHGQWPAGANDTAATPMHSCGRHPGVQFTGTRCPACARAQAAQANGGARSGGAVR